MIPVTLVPKNRFVNSFASILLLFVLATSAFGNHKLNQLLNSPKRPTMAEFLACFDGSFPQQDPFGLDHSSVVSIVESNAPDFIVRLEYAFPNFVLAPVGRDVVFTGDIIDAFFLSIGQTDRVTRINGSGTTIRGADPALLAKMLQDAGINLANVKRPYIFYDRTSYDGGSQTRQLVNAAYMHSNTSADTLSNYIFAMNMSASTIEPGTRNAVLNQLKMTVQSTGIGGLIGMNYLGNYSGHGGDNHAWHGTFGSLQNVDGKFQGAIGSASNVETRKSILSHMYWAFRAVTSDTFRRNMAATASRYGVSFGGQSSATPAEIFKPKPPVQPSDLGRLVSTLGEAGEQDGRFTPNGDVLNDWFQEAMAYAIFQEEQAGDQNIRNQTVVKFVQMVLASRPKDGEVQKIGSRDYRRLLNMALAQMDPTPQMTQWFANLVNTDGYLRKVWITKREFFTVERQPEGNISSFYNSLIPHLDAVICQELFQ